MIGVIGIVKITKLLDSNGLLDPSGLLAAEEMLRLAKTELATEDVGLKLLELLSSTKEGRESFRLEILWLLEVARLLDVAKLLDVPRLV